MLRRNLTLFALTLGTTFAAAAACSSDSGGGGSSGGSGGSGASGGSGGTGGSDAGNDATTGMPDPEMPGTQPPADPKMPTADGTSATTLAVRKLFLGDTDREGTPSAGAWKDLGFNLDGILSTKSGSNHCAPVKGANPANVKTDGNGGIDNSFGANLMPIITSVAADASTGINTSLENGEFTIIVHMANLGTAATQAGIDSKLYAGAPLMAPPAWDGTDVWPVTFEFLTGGNIDTPKVAFPTSYMVDGTWVSGSKGDLPLTVALQGIELKLLIRNALVAMDVTGTGATATAVNGTIAGVLKTDELVQSLREVAGTLDVSLCEGSTFESIAQQIRAASDIMQDGSNGDASQTCDGISVGLGFSADAIVLGDVADPVPPGVDPCAM